ncbi:choline/ethanolamine kinase domain-containing protein [Phthorimaea operculella]|nr:choline/ethanolamine kinase domain-containing protein [Phthorimaea operculella]
MAKKLQKCGTEEEMREVAGRICKNYLHGLWKVVQPEEIKFRRISGGLSNFIYAVGLPDNLKPLYARLSELEEDEMKAVQSAMEAGDEPKQVLLRIYGQVHGERAMDAIVTESVIFTLLSERRLGPKLFGVFSGGRIEEFIPARALLTKELSEPAISMKIAEKTAAIHSMDIPLSKEPNYIWKSMYKWLKTVKEECFTNGIKGKNEIEQTAIRKLKEMNYDNEIEWLKKYLMPFESPVVFCHNDLQEGNILILEGDTQVPCDEYESSSFVPEFTGTDKSMDGLAEAAHSWPEHDIDSTASRAAFLSQTNQTVHRPSFEEEDTVLSEPPGEPKLYLIDFEYCAYNHRAFDIANHFQEWAYDYTNPEHPFYYEHRDDWPTIEQKEIFIREYLKYYNANTNEDKQPVEPDIDAVNKLLAEVEAFALASHLFWTLWSIVNASKSQIPFGYWEYGQSRLETYLRLKQEVIKKEQLGLPQKRKIEEVDI